MLSSRHLGIAFGLNLAFAIIEVGGGFWTHSIAILSDALHDFGDAFALGIGWYLQTLSQRGRDRTYSYGYQRFNVLGALINAVILLGGSIWIIQESISRFSKPQMPHAAGMVALAILGVLVNGAAVWQMKKGSSINERVMSLHLMEDVLGWLAVLIGGTIMYFYPIYWIDPLLSIAIAFFILYNAFNNLRFSGKIILQRIPEQIDTEKICSSLQDLPEVKDIHDVRLWTLDGDHHVLTLHVVVNQEQTMQELGCLKEEIKNRLSHLDVLHATIEFELPDEQCGNATPSLTGETHAG
jgi:cobalt-zinc-cadmium efflux system protein